MTITRIDPFRELASFFENFTEPTGKDQLSAGSFVPPVDVYEDEQNLILKLEIPGLNDEDINVSVENNTLTVQGERKFEKEEKEENFHRIERRYGSFVRTFKLPHRGCGEGGSRLRQRHFEDHAGQAGRSQAAADQSWNRPEDPPGVSGQGEGQRCL